MLMRHDIQQLACNPPTNVGIDRVLIQVLIPVWAHTVRSSGKKKLRKAQGEAINIWKKDFESKDFQCPV